MYKKENLKLKIPQREEIVKCFEKFYFGGDPNKDSKYWSGYITNEELLVCLLYTSDAADE